MRVVRLKAVKSCLKTTVQHLYPLQLQRERKDNHALVEEWSHKTDTTSRSKQTAAVIANIAIKYQVTDEIDTLQVE